MRQFLYFLCIGTIWFIICFAVLGIPVFLLDREMTTTWKGLAIVISFGIVSAVKPFLKRHIRGISSSEEK